MSDIAAAFKAIQDRLRSDPVIIEAVSDRIGAFPVNGLSYPYIGYGWQGGSVKRFVAGHEGYSRLRIQVSVIGPASMRPELFAIESRIQYLLAKHRDVNDYGEAMTFLRDAEIDIADPDMIAGDRIIRIGSIWMAIAKGA